MGTTKKHTHLRRQTQVQRNKMETSDTASRNQKALSTNPRVAMSARVLDSGLDQ